MIGVIHKTHEEHGKTIMSSWSNDIYYMIPFTLEKPAPKQDIMMKASKILAKASHWAGCGYSKSVQDVHMTSPTTGWIEMMEYNGIGD